MYILLYMYLPVVDQIMYMYIYMYYCSLSVCIYVYLYIVHVFTINALCMILYINMMIYMYMYMQPLARCTCLCCVCVCLVVICCCCYYCLSKGYSYYYLLFLFPLCMLIHTSPQLLDSPFPRVRHNKGTEVSMCDPAHSQQICMYQQTCPSTCIQRHTHLRRKSTATNSMILTLSAC